MTKVKDKNKKVEPKKEKDIVFIILVILLIGLSLFLIIYRVVNGKNINTESKEVKQLYDYLNADKLSNCNGLFMYTDKEVKYDNLNSENKLCLAYQMADISEAEEEEYTPKKKESTCKIEDSMVFRADDETGKCQVTKIQKNVIDDTYKQVFGKDIENNTSFKINNSEVCYLKDDYYYCGQSETITYVLGNDSTIYRVINNAAEKGNKIIIYDYFTKIIDSTCYATYTTDIQLEKCSKAYEKNNNIEYKFMRKYTTKYEHVFEKDEDGNYHWVSTKPLTKLS